MPIPQPTPDESRKEFMDRCMGDDAMVNDYPDSGQRVAVCAAQFGKRKQGDIAHNSETQQSPVPWADVNKTQLPLKAFAWEAEGTDKNNKSTWKYPHHYVVNGVLGDNNTFEQGIMYLSADGLSAALAMAEADEAKKAIEHLRAHQQQTENKTMNGKAVLQTARTPEYEGTEDADWSAVDKTLENYVAGYYAANPDAEQPEGEAGERLETLPAAAKRWIAAKSLLGNEKAETFDELLFFPVVNPDTNRLNRNALVAVLGGRGSQADIPQDVIDSAQDKSRTLLKDEFDMESDGGKAEMPRHVIKRAVDAQFKAEVPDGGPMRISGYGSVFDVVDSQGDIIKKGAFAKTIQEKVANGKVLLMVRHFAHGGDTGEAIGMIKSAREDEYGLWYTADLYDTQLAKDTHAKLKVSPNAFGSSVGFMPIKRSEIDSGYEYAEVALYEITVTAVPANEFTSAQAKREEMVDNIRKRIAELEAKVAELSTAAVPAESVGGAGEGDNGSSRAKSLPATISNKRRRLMAILEAEMEQEK